MKKLLTLGVMLALSTSVTLAATNFGDTFKKAVKQDIENQKKEAKEYNQSMKDAIKKDIEAKKNEQFKAQNEAKAKKLAEINKKLADLNKELANTKNDKTITYTEKTIRIKSLNRQIEFYQKQKDAMK